MSLSIGPGQHHAGDAIDQSLFVEVDQQAQRHFQQFHVTQKLCLVNRQNFFDTLQLQKQAVLEKKVESQRLIKDKSFVLHGHDTLLNEANVPQLQFVSKALFVSALNQSRPLVSMNFNRRANGLPAKRV